MVVSPEAAKSSILSPQSLSADVGPAKCSPDRFPHGDNSVFTRSWRILPDVNLYSVRNRQPPPAQHHVSIVRDGFIGIRSESRSKRLRDPFLERIAGDFLELRSDRIETLSLALPDLDREKLEKVPVTVRRTGSRSLGAVEQSARDVESNRASTRRGAR